MKESTMTKSKKKRMKTTPNLSLCNVWHSPNLKDSRSWTISSTRSSMSISYKPS